MDMQKRRWIHFIIMMLLTVVVCLCPPFGSITESGMKVLGIFAGVLYGWIFIDLIWPSIFGFVGLGVIGAGTVLSSFAAGIGNVSLIMILVTMVFAGALEEAGLTDFLADWFLKRKIFRKSPWLLIGGIVFGAFILSILGASLAAIFLLWSLILKVADECKIPRNDHLISFCIMMIVAAGMNGGCVLPFSSGSLIYLGFLTQATGVTIPYIPFIIFAFTMLAGAMVILFLAGKILFRLDASKFVLPEDVIAELESKKSTKGQRVTFLILILYIMALLLPGLIPAFPGMQFLSTLGIVGMSSIALLVMNVIVIDGKPLINLANVFTKHVQWPLILLLAVTFPLASAMQADTSGIMVTITELVTPIVANMGVVTFMIVAMVILGCVTQITHNIVLAAMFMPFLCPLCEQLGGNMITMWFMLFIILQCAYVTPAASMNSAMVHGHECMIKKDAYILGVAYLVITILLLSIVGIPLGNLLF